MPRHDDCPTPVQYRECLTGGFSDDETDQILNHLEWCPVCQEVACGMPGDELVPLIRQAGEATTLDRHARGLAERIVGKVCESLIDANATVDTAAADPTTSGPGSLLRPAESADEVGRLGGYRVLDTLGEGGMGRVYLAEDPDLHRRIALKVMLPQAAGKAGAKARFLREARATAKLKDDHVIDIYQVGEDNGVPFIAMPLLEGETLASRLQREGALPPEEVARVGREAALGLAAAHAKGLIHRDVKPSNIWLEADTGRVKLVDFGLARAAESEDEPVTQSGVVLGTPAYMAPEQADGQAGDARGDIFSLGVVLHEAATGTRAFDGPSVMSILKKVATHVPPPVRSLRPEIPEGVSSLIEWMMAKDAADRPESALEVARRLQDAPSRGGSPGRPTPARPPKPPRRAVWPWVLAGGAAVAVVVAVVAATLSGDRPDVTRPAPPGGPEAPVAAGRPPSGDGQAAIGGQRLYGWIDVFVEKQGKAGPEQRLHEEGVLPLQPGDRMRIDVEMTTGPAYLYVVWLESDGDAVPLTPWVDNDWTQLPEHEPRERVEISGPLGESPAGIETLLLLVRREPLPPGADVARFFADLPEQDGVTDPQVRVWLENGQQSSDRGAPAFRRGAGDLIRDLQRRLRGEELRELFPYTRSVSFSFRGD